jgi:nicotinate-nucleotide adenylyltransferase
VLIFGGTFDPPHRAHVELPQIAARELDCHRIIYIPAALNPLKTGGDAPPPTPAEHRLAMLRLALRDVPNTEINTIELERPPPSFAIDTLRALFVPASEARAGAFLLIGADQALDFHRWREWPEILKLARPAVMLRPPWTRELFTAAVRGRYNASEAPQWLAWTLTTLPLLDVNATDIRARLVAGRSVAGLIDPKVEAFIRDHGLYHEP